MSSSDEDLNNVVEYKNIRYVNTGDCYTINLSREELAYIITATNAYTRKISGERIRYSKKNPSVQRKRKKLLCYELTDA